MGAIFFDRQSCHSDALSPALVSLNYERQLFIAAFLSLSRSLLELGRIPVFEEPAITAIRAKDSPETLCLLDIAVRKIDALPPAAYEMSFKAALLLCRQMIDWPPTPANREKLFSFVERQLIQPLRQMVRAGESTIPVLRVAHSLGIPFLHLGLGAYQLGWGSKARRMDRSTTELDSALGAKLTQNKAVTADFLRRAGFPVPVHTVVGTESGALAAAQRLEFPVVVKPVDCDRGEGVAVDVNDSDTLRASFALALALAKSKQVIIERQVPGVCHRLFIVDGRLLYAVKRLPMSVTGDGKRTVAQLVSAALEDQAAKAPWLRSAIQAIDAPALDALSHAGLSPESVPAAGILAPLRRIESTASGGVDEDVTTIIHPDNVAAAIGAARVFRLHVAGVDIISQDISLPWHQNGAVINEVNYAPLFGGAEISRSHIPKFFADFIEGDGKIPIDFFQEQNQALARQQEYQTQGRRCFLVNQEKIVAPDGKLVALALQPVRDRIKALIFRSDVDAIVAVTNEK